MYKLWNLYLYLKSLAKATEFCVIQAVRRIILGQLIGKIIIIVLSFRVRTSKNKTMDHQGYIWKWPYSLTYWCNSVKCNIFFSFIFCKLKEKDYIRRKINSKKMFICEISIIILICQKFLSVKRKIFLNVFSFCFKESNKEWQAKTKRKT